jgi:hypothetical protein
MPIPATSSTVDSSVFKIFFLCEDSLSLNRAMALKETLVENCRDQADIEAHFCEYARLCHPRLRENATVHAAAADMIVISAQGSDGLPAFVQMWMNELGSRCSDKTVCAEYLHTDSSDRASSFHRYMNKWATQKGILLFSNLFPTYDFGELIEAVA